jgi:hypothetical protein
MCVKHKEVFLLMVYVFYLIIITILKLIIHGANEFFFMNSILYSLIVLVEVTRGNNCGKLYHSSRSFKKDTMHVKIE